MKNVVKHKNFRIFPSYFFHFLEATVSNKIGNHTKTALRNLPSLSWPRTVVKINKFWVAHARLFFPSPYRCLCLPACLRKRPSVCIEANSRARCSLCGTTVYNKRLKLSDYWNCGTTTGLASLCDIHWFPHSQ